MDRAVQKARAGFADFLKKFAAPPAGTHDFTVKVDLAGGIGASEAVWRKPFVVRERDVVGTIANTPEMRTEFKQGQVIAVARADVLDWSYREGEKRRGNFTPVPCSRTSRRRSGTPPFAILAWIVERVGLLAMT